MAKNLKKRGKPDTFLKLSHQTGKLGTNKIILFFFFLQQKKQKNKKNAHFKALFSKKFKNLN
ncbi:Predicted protein [Mesomycoplasma hyopneumoniae 168]|uniref:Uncharacterized protein n=2 Tax=Mesomycoplasma hyopneumoniae (strain 168) TaxID=907287 RepID=E4QSJ7_MESH1|nr:Predicted protein [Mesomycoplasma hyopneumoniae 168]AGM21974.1 hypothetical protein MHP168L_193 [Mesomycoplasma hyopneumoniae 168-L]